MKESVRTLIAVAAVCVLALSHAVIQGDVATDRKEVAAELPAYVAELFFSVEDLSEIPKDKIVEIADGDRTEDAQRDCLKCVKQVIRESMRPAEEEIVERLIPVRDQIGDQDVGYVEWEADGYVLRIAVVNTFFALTVKPSEGAFGWETPEEKFLGIAELASKIFVDLPPEEVPVPLDGEWTGRDIAPEGTLRDLLKYSFSQGTRERGEFLIGPDPPEGGHLPARPDPGRLAIYWWRMVDWWTDGKRAGFYAPNPWFNNLGQAVWWGYHRPSSAGWFEHKPRAQSKGGG